MIDTGIPKVNGVKELKYTLKAGKKSYKAILQKPSLNVRIAAINELYMVDSVVNMYGSGKKIFDSCCTEHSKDITDDVLLGFFSELATEFCVPAKVEVKKN